MFMAAMNRAMSLGAKHGLRAIPMFCDPSIDTPEIGDGAAEGAVGIVVTLACVMVALYITILIAGSMSKTVMPGDYNATSGLWEGGSTGVVMNNAFNNTLKNADTNSQASFSLAGILPIAIVGVGILVIIISAFSMR